MILANFYDFLKKSPFFTYLIIYKGSKSLYNDIEEAKNELDSSTLKYIEAQNNLDELYLNTVVSAYAAESFRQAKINKNHQNIINEIIAEVCVIGTTKDPKLNKLIRKELNYGKTRATGHLTSTQQRRN